jgi:hypothetical protein
MRGALLEAFRTAFRSALVPAVEVLSATNANAYVPVRVLAGICTKDAATSVRSNAGSDRNSRATNP